jgi:hypothetical protein
MEKGVRATRTRSSKKRQQAKHTLQPPPRHPPPPAKRAAARTVSLVGRIAMGFSICVVPLRVTHATSGAKPSTWSFSVLSTSSVMNSGK